MWTFVIVLSLVNISLVGVIVALYRMARRQAEVLEEFRRQMEGATEPMSRQGPADEGAPAAESGEQ